MAGMVLASRNVLGSSGWIGPATVRISGDGLISEVTAGNGGARQMHGPLVPGMPNVHSHAFQRQMAGLTEGPAGQAAIEARSLVTILEQPSARTTPRPPGICVLMPPAGAGPGVPRPKSLTF